MNKEQHDKACAVIKNDATGRVVLLDRATGEYCALGGLLSAAGVSNTRLLRPHIIYTDFLPILERAYGIATDTRLRQIWRTNDSYRVVGPRRRALVALFDEWLAEDRAEIAAQ